MSHGDAGDVNYWPAYVDALINVVLNLLFLVGVFTIGLVSLNAQALFAEKAAKQHALDTLAQTSAQLARQPWTQVYGTRPKSPAEDALEAAQAGDASAGSISASGGSALASAPRTRASQAASAQNAPRVVEIRLLASAPAPSPDDTRSATASAGEGDSDFESFLARLKQHGPSSRMVFDINQYSQPKEWVWPQEVSPGASDQAWWLFVVSDPTNPRLSREAFARLVAVRTALLKAGALAERVRMQVIPAPPGVIPPPGSERTVWVVARPPF